MASHKLRTLRATLLFVMLLFSATSAFAQLVRIGPQGATVAVPQVIETRVGVQRLDPSRLLRDPIKVPTTDLTLKVQPIGPLTPDVKVNVNTGAPGRILDAGVSVAGTNVGGAVASAPAVPPAPEASSATLVAGTPQAQLEKRIELLPTCR
jgi:hypothetical protein